MADEAQQQLMLQIDASVELLRRNLLSGEQPMDRLERRAAKMADGVDKSIAKMGSALPNFARMAEDAATKAQRSFESSFNAIERQAAKALSSPIAAGGGFSMGSAEMRDAAEAARLRAQAIGLIEQAAIRAAAGEGELTQETRMYIAAAQAARIAAEQQANELTREAGAAERLEIELKQLGATQLVTASNARVATAMAGQQRGATMMLGQQVQDFFVMTSNGGSVMTAFSTQIGQAAFAIQQMGGSATGVAAFLGSGWGTAILVALTAITPYVGKLLEGNDELDKAVEKLRAEGRQTELTARAHDIFTRTIEGQIVAQRKLNDEMDRSVITQRQLQLGALRNARTELADSESRRPAQIAEIDKQRRLVESLEKSQKGFLDPGARAGLLQQLTFARDKLTELQDQLAKLDAQIARGSRAIREAEVPLIQNDVAASLDKRTAAVQRYEAAVGNLNIRLAIGAGRSEFRDVHEGNGVMGRRSVTGIDPATYRRELARVTAERDRDVNAAAAAKKISNAEVNPSVVSNLLRAQFGGTITSTTGGKHVAGSDHYRGQAVDFVPRGGVNAVSKAEIEAYLESQGINVKQLLGPGDKDHNDHFHVAFTKSRRSQATIAKREETLAERAERERIKALDDATAYSDRERQARGRLIDATKRTAASEEQRDQLVRDDINAEANARKTDIANDLAAQKLTPAQAAHLDAINEATRKQRLQNIEIARAARIIERQYEAASDDAQAQLALLRIREGMATTAADRRKIGEQMLALEQEERRRAFERIRDNPNSDADEVQRAKDALGRLPAQEAAERERLRQDQASPLEQYKRQLIEDTSDMHEALELVAVRGFGALEDAGAREIQNLLKLKGAFGEFASSVIADLARIAIQKGFVELIGGLFGGGSSNIANSASSLLGGIGKKFGGARAGGGPVDPSQFYLVGERGPELFAPSASGIILPNRLPTGPSLAGRGGAGASGTLKIQLALSGDIDAKIDSRAANVSVQVYREAAPQLIEAATAATVGALGRPGI